MLHEAIPPSVATLFLMAMIQGKYRVSEEYQYQIKRSLVYFDDAVNSLGEVTMIANGQRVRLDKKEWARVEEFFKRLVLGDHPKYP